VWTWPGQPRVKNTDDNGEEKNAEDELQFASLSAHKGFEAASETPEYHGCHAAREKQETR
jgi:hypothetical protein